MHIKRFFSLILTGVILSGLAVAQTGTGTYGSATTGMGGSTAMDTARREADRNSNFNLGWLGLLGLAGLIPLFARRSDIVVDPRDNQSPGPHRPV